MHILRAEFERSATSELPPEGPPEVALCGRSNVGKSSLMNWLCQRSLARVSRAPGRTRLLNFFLVEGMDGERRRLLRLVDLPGYGYARVSKGERSSWRAAIQSYLEHRGALAVVVLLIDARRGPLAEERDLAAWLRGARRAVVPVVTKVDQVAKHERRPIFERIRSTLGVTPLATSIRLPDGREELWRRILDHLPDV